MSEETYRNAKASIEDRVTDLLSRMTVEEKVGQMVQVRNAAEEHDSGVRAGHIGSCIIASGPFAGNERDEGVHIRRLTRLQKIAVEESRLGIPLIYARDVIHGYRTVFPIPLGQAATWNPELVRQGAEIAAREASSTGIHWTFTPMVEVGRDPRWGRIAEGFGEDPYLASRLTSAAVEGYQGDDMSQPDRLAACVKHYAGYSVPEGGREYNTVELGERTLRDVYLPPFKAAAKAGVATVMSSFNEIDGVPVSADRYLLTEVLKEEWDWDGFIISDYGIIATMCGAFGVAADLREAAAMCANAGLDMDMCASAYSQHLVSLVEDGTVSEAQVNSMVGRILRIKFRCGLFEHPYADENRAKKVILAPQHRAVARKAACESMVLLKNTGILPLASEGGTVLVTGPLARARGELYGTWNLDGQPGDVISIGEALTKKLGEDREVHLDNPAGMGGLSRILARQAEMVVACLGEGPWLSGEGNSIASLELPAGQLELVEALHELGKPVIAVVCAGRPLAIGRLCELADAVIYAWHPGVEAGQAVADVLLGTTNPGGRTPVTFPRSAGQVPTHYAHKPIHNDAWFGSDRANHYRDQLATPLFPFGFGLDYTSYRYTNLRISPERASMDGSVSISVDVENVGSRTGSEVAQLYVRDVLATVTRPLKELKAFEKIALKAGEKKTVTFTLSGGDLTYTGRDMRPTVEPGEFKVWVGPNAAEGIEGTFELAG